MLKRVYRRYAGLEIHQKTVTAFVLIAKAKDEVEVHKAVFGRTGNGWVGGTAAVHAADIAYCILELPYCGSLFIPSRSIHSRFVAAQNDSCGEG